MSQSPGPIHKIEQEQQLLTDILSFSHHPLEAIRYAFPWGQPGTPLANQNIRQWQVQALTEIGEHVRQQQFALDNDLPLTVYKEAVKSGRGSGKSALFGMLTWWQLSCHLGSTVTVTANTESQLRSKTFPEFGRWFTMAINSHWWWCEGMAVTPREWIAKLVREQLKIDTEYWEARGQNWSEENPDSFAGTHNSYGLAVFYDEASGIAEPIWNVTQGFFTELNPFRFWIAYSNPRRNAGAFYNRFNKPEFQDTWRTKTIDVRKVEGVDPAVYESILKEHGEESDVARVEVYGEFPEAGDAQFIPNSYVRGAQQREIGPVIDEDQPLIMGVDPAPRGRTVIRFRQGRDARSIKPTVIQSPKSHNVIVNQIVDLVDKYDPDAIVVDAGNGLGVIDALKDRRIRSVFEVWMGVAAEDSNGEFQTLGSELWGKMRDWLPGGCIDSSETLFRDLTVRTWQWAGREDGKKVLTPKKEMARDGIPSPDDGDALALTFYPRLPRRSRRAGRRGSGPQIAQGMDEDLI